jgi:hypothetical protein
MNIFKHGGACGDIIFSLPVVKQLGGGVYHITMKHEQRSESIKKLLEVQEYISDVYLIDPVYHTHDLDNFRNVFTGAHDNIIDAHFRGQSIHNDNTWKDGWLTLPELDIEFSKWNYCVINRTERYNDPNCDWYAELDYLKSEYGNIVFIGYYDEYLKFSSQYGSVDYLDLDFLQGAYLLKHAKMFTGNYSSWATIAQGLGINYRLEQAPDHTCSSLFIKRETIINA